MIMLGSLKEERDFEDIVKFLNFYIFIDLVWYFNAPYNETKKTELLKVFDLYDSII